MANNKDNNFWTTLPGVFTGFAAVITAMGGLYLNFHTSTNSPTHTTGPTVSPGEPPIRTVSPTEPPISEDDPDSLYSNAEKLEKSGNKDGAIDAYNRAGRLYHTQGDEADANNSWGDASELQGDKQKAIEYYQKAADLYEKQGKTKDYQDARERIKELE
jgi:tetratricopeptide (TPR) repeat protein